MRRPDSRAGRLTASALLLVLSCPLGMLASAPPALAQTPEEEVRSRRALSNEAIELFVTLHCEGPGCP